MLAFLFAGAAGFLYFMDSIDRDWHAKNAFVILEWLDRAEKDRAHQSELQRFFGRPAEPVEHEVYHFSPRYADTWGIHVDYAADGRVERIQVDGRTPAEFAVFYRE
jgi:hypothetical protein